MKKGQKEKKVFSAVTSGYLAILLSLYLLYPGTGGYQSITDQKWNAYLAVTGAYLLAMLLLRLELAAVGSAGLPGPKRLWRSTDLTQKLIFGYLLACAVSTLLSDHLPAAFTGSDRRDGLVAIALYSLSFLTVAATVKPKRWMLWVFAAAMSLNCCLCLVQLTGRNPLRLYPEGMTYYDANKKYAGEFLGTIGNVDILSALLSLSVPAFWTALLRLKGDRTRFLLLIPLALCLAVLLKAFVAGGILGIGGAVVLSAPLLFPGKRARKAAAAGVACLCVLGLLAVYFFGARFGGFLYEASELMHGNWSDEFGTGRVYIWRSVLPLVRERPLFGGGPDTLGLRTDAAFERFDESLGILIHSRIDNAHNEYLNILINEGLIALLLYLAALAASAGKWLRTFSDRPAAALCGCAVLGYAIQALFGICSPITAPYFWMALAFLSAGRPENIPADKVDKRRGKRL